MHSYWVLTVIVATLFASGGSVASTAVGNQPKLSTETSTEFYQGVSVDGAEGNGKRLLRGSDQITIADGVEDDDDEDDKYEDEEDGAVDDTDEERTYLTNKLGTMVGQVKNAQRLKAQAEAQQVENALKLVENQAPAKYLIKAKITPGQYAKALGLKVNSRTTSAQLEVLKNNPVYIGWRKYEKLWKNSAQ